MNRPLLRADEAERLNDLLDRLSEARAELDRAEGRINEARHLFERCQNELTDAIRALVTP
jgi:predicted  nucleic acid-binding Zn-ribbon protein